MSGIILGGAAIGALGTIGAGFLGSRSSKKQQRAAQAFEAQRIRMMANDAKLAGIHPLAALGVAANYQNPMMGVGDGGFANSVGSAAQSIGQGLTDYGQGQKAKKAQDTANALAERQLQQRERALQVDAYRAETDRMVGTAQMKRMQVETANALRQFRYENVGGPSSPAPKVGPGTGPGVDGGPPINKYRQVVDKFGQLQLDVNPGMSDPEQDIWHWTKDVYTNQSKRDRVSRTTRRDLAEQIRERYGLDNLRARSAVRFIEQGMSLDEAVEKARKL